MNGAESKLLFKDIHKGMSIGHKLILFGMICLTSLFGTYVVVDSEQFREKHIRIEYGYTHNLGDYESMRIRVGFDRRLSNGEDPERIMNYELDQLREFIHRKIDQYEKMNK